MCKMTELTLAFSDLYTAIVTEQRTLDPFFPKTIQSLTTFNRILNIVQNNDLDSFVLNNYSQLSSIYSFIREQAIPRTTSFEDYLREENKGSKKSMFRSMYTAARKKLTSLLEKIYKDQLKINVKRDGKLPTLCTPIFENFIIGITKFTDAKQERAFPSYHRSESCGPYEENQRFRQSNKNCLKKNISTKEIQRRKAIAERCFLERLIYDEIYKQCCCHTETQDKGHITAIKQSQEDYMGCYPGQDIKVHVEMHMNLPHTLVIEKYQNNKLVVTEKYHRQLVSNNNVIRQNFAIECEKEDHKRHRKYFKCQSIYRPEERWISLESVSRASSPMSLSKHIRHSRTY
jgi:hypothetical protein